MQRIDRMLKALPESERRGVLAWLFEEYGPQPARPEGVNCKHPGYGIDKLPTHFLTK